MNLSNQSRGKRTLLVILAALAMLVASTAVAPSAEATTEAADGEHSDAYSEAVAKAEKAEMEAERLANKAANKVEQAERADRQAAKAAARAHEAEQRAAEATNPKRKAALVRKAEQRAKWADAAERRAKKKAKQAEQALKKASKAERNAKRARQVADDLMDTGGNEGFNLNILHINDHHSNLDPSSGDLDFNDQGTRVEVGGFPRVVAKMAELEAAAAAADGADSVVKIHAGDAITGTLYYSLFGGEADAALMNEVCFDIFELGNHEFDGGDEGLKTFLDFLAAGDCKTDVLGANVVPAVGTPLAPESSTDYIKPFTIREVDGNQVGFVGLNIADKTRLSSSPLDTTEFLDELETAQHVIDQLAHEGIHNIVLVTHVQLANDIALAEALNGVDVIVGGDSHTLLGDFEQYGLNVGGSYPVTTTNADGNQVCIVQAWQYSAIVGELNVSFDGHGNVSSCQGTPHLLLGDTFLRRPAPDEDRAPVEGDALKEIQDIINGDPQLSIVAPDADAEAVLSGFSEEVEVLSQQVIGTATEDLCLERIPGQGRSTICDVSDTAVNGGDIQQLVAAAFLARSFEADIAIQNSGGVRIDIPAGDITIADAYTLLPFANTAINLDMTGAEIEATIQEAIDFATAEGGSTGAYPYASGLQFDVDLTQPEGSRASNFLIRPKGTDTFVALDSAATYKVVANSFIASGGDSYTTMEAVSEDGRAVDTFIDYAQAFIDYVEQDSGGVISKLPVEEYSTQSFVAAP